MCLVFPLKFVNLVVYMTTPASQPPRTDSWSLRQFLDNVANERQTRTWSADGRARLREAAEESLRILAPSRISESVSPERLHEVVAPVKRVLEDHLLFLMPAGDWASSHQI